MSTGLHPGQFNEMCNPAWARVFIELSHDRNSVDSRLAWLSPQVKEWFIRLAGFDPTRTQYADMEQQHSALNSVRDLERALYEADEVAELDGFNALYFASGWMSARDFLNGAKDSDVTDDEIRLIAKRYISAHHSKPDTGKKSAFNESFESGFICRMRLGVNYVA